MEVEPIRNFLGQTRLPDLPVSHTVCARPALATWYWSPSLHFVHPVLVVVYGETGYYETVLRYVIPLNSLLVAHWLPATNEHNCSAQKKEGSPGTARSHRQLDLVYLAPRTTGGGLAAFSFWSLGCVGHRNSEPPSGNRGGSASFIQH